MQVTEARRLVLAQPLVRAVASTLFDIVVEQADAGIVTEPEFGLDDTLRRLDIEPRIVAQLVLNEPIAAKASS